jgi:hypothetical protein
MTPYPYTYTKKLYIARDKQLGQCTDVRRTDLVLTRNLESYRRSCPTRRRDFDALIIIQRIVRRDELTLIWQG